MGGTREGGLKSAETIKAEDPNYYRKLGKKGGAKSRGGGFTGRPDIAAEYGSIGGKISRRGKSKKGKAS